MPVHMCIELGTLSLGSVAGTIFSILLTNKVSATGSFNIEAGVVSALTVYKLERTRVELDAKAHRRRRGDRRNKLRRWVGRREVLYIQPSPECDGAGADADEEDVGLLPARVPESLVRQRQLGRPGKHLGALPRKFQAHSVSFALTDDQLDEVLGQRGERRFCPTLARVEDESAGRS